MAKRQERKFQKPPFFKLDWAAWLSCKWVRRMNGEQRGWYMQMLIESWAATPTCYLENNLENIQMSAGLKLGSESPIARAEIERFDNTAAIVLDRFETTPDGKYIFNPRLLREYEDLLAVRMKLQKAGMKGARGKWNGNKKIQTEKPDGPAIATPQPPYGHPIQKEKEVERETEVEKEKFKDSCLALVPSAPPEVPFIKFPLNDGSEHPVGIAEVLQYKQLYPAVNVEQALRSMLGWLMAEPTRRKTKRGISKFINGWLAREQDKGGNNGNGKRQATSNAADAREQRIVERYRRLTGTSENPFGTANDSPAGDDGSGAIILAGNSQGLLPR